MVFEREAIKYGEPDEVEEQTPIEEEDAGEDGADEEEEEEEMVEWPADQNYPKSGAQLIQEFAKDPTTTSKELQASLASLKDPLETIRLKCEQTEHCMHAKERLEACETRVGSRSHTEEECTEELFDFLHARDHCVAQKLFSSVK